MEGNMLRFYQVIMNFLVINSIKSFNHFLSRKIEDFPFRISGQIVSRRSRDKFELIHGVGPRPQSQGTVLDIKRKIEDIQFAASVD